MEINNARKLLWTLGLLAGWIVAAACIFSWSRMSLPTRALKKTETAINAKAGSDTLPASHSIPWNKTSPQVAKLAAQYPPLPASLPPLDQLGGGEFTEQQERDYFKHHTGLDLLPIASEVTGSYNHRHNRLGISGHQKLYLTLPPIEAKALFDIVSAKWKKEHPTDEDGFGFNQGVRPYPTEFRDGDHYPGGTHVISYSSYEREPRKRVYLLLNPTSGRMRLWWHYEEDQ